MLNKLAVITPDFHMLHATWTLIYLKDQSLSFLTSKISIQFSVLPLPSSYPLHLFRSSMKGWIISLFFKTITVLMSLLCKRFLSWFHSLLFSLKHFCNAFMPVNFSSLHAHFADWMDSFINQKSYTARNFERHWVSVWFFYPLCFPNQNPSTDDYENYHRSWFYWQILLSFYFFWRGFYFHKAQHNWLEQDYHFGCYFWSLFFNWKHFSYWQLWKYHRNQLWFGKF